jgi:uncharacterized membrane protein
MENQSMDLQKSNMLMGILAYLGVFVLVPYLVVKDDAFVKFHVKQGLVLFVIEAGIWILSGIFWVFAPIAALLNIGLLVLSILGIVNVVQKQEKELPLVGGYASHFSF